MNVSKPAEDMSDRDEHARWTMEIALYEKQADPWEIKSKKILRRYRDERNLRDENKAQYNILWANVQTMAPALYARNPKPDIQRRQKQKDDAGRLTADTLERSTTYFTDTEEFGNVMRSVVLDRLLPGRGTAWVRYVPHFRDAEIRGNEEVEGEGVQVTDSAYAEQERPVEEIYFEEVCFDYVHWQDFGHNIARTVAEVYARWRIVYLTRQELVERFGEEIGMAIPLDYSPKGLNDEKIAEELKKASIYEIWDKRNKKAIWFHKDYPKIVDKKHDPLRLQDFFPCPVPILGTTANDSLIPTPDFVQYQDQAAELDMLTARIASINRSIKVAGVCAGGTDGIRRLLNEGVENELIEVEQWAMFAEKGGLKGVIELLPMQEIAQTLMVLYETREKVKNDLYEIMGIADIIRGQSNPNETLGAQQLKGQYATLRLSAMGDEVQRFARDLVKIAAQIIAEHFQLDTIKKISGVHLLTEQEKQMITQFQQMQAQAAQQQQAQQQQAQQQQEPQQQMPPQGAPQ